MFSLENDSDKNSNVLGVRVKDYGECGWCLDDENRVVLNVSWDVWSQWMHVSQQMGSREWGGVFWVKDNTITSFKIPKQEVSSVECEFKEELGGDGMVHSHHSMGAFHSSQDDRHARNLYAYSIVLSNGKGYEATKRVKMPCDGFGYVKVELRLTGCPDMDISNIHERELDLGVSSKKECQEELNFGSTESPCNSCELYDCENCEYLGFAPTPCDGCDTFDCRACKFVIGKDFGEALPFCELCEDEGMCKYCIKLARYLKHYPEDKKQFDYLLQ